MCLPYICAPSLCLSVDRLQSTEAGAGINNMASGVKVAEEVKIKYDDIKKKKSYRYLVFFIKENIIIISCVDGVGIKFSYCTDRFQLNYLKLSVIMVKLSNQSTFL